MANTVHENLVATAKTLTEAQLIEHIEIFEWAIDLRNFGKKVKTAEDEEIEQGMRDLIEIFKAELATRKGVG